MKADSESHRPVMSRLAALLKEPLLHFTIAGAVLFAGYAAMQPAPLPDPGGPIRIAAGEIGWLRETFSAQWRRDPTREELATLVDTLVREQLLAREARALGLDQDDTIVRRRLAQKLMFLVEDTTRIGDPDDVELRRYLAANAERYRSEPRLTFLQVFYSPKRRADAPADALADLARISQPTIPEGDPLPLDGRFSQVDPPAVSSLFGPAFAKAVFGLAPNTWAGPVKSAYGVHLVLVTERTEGRPRPFEEVRQAVLDDWRRQKAQDAAEAYVAKLRDKYGVVVDGSANILQSRAASAPAAP